MARYQGHVGVFRANRAAWVWKSPAFRRSKNYIDDEVFKKLKALGLPISQLSDDSTFLRRATTIDVAGRLPVTRRSRGVS